jgi:hypothetical protein
MKNRGEGTLANAGISQWKKGGTVSESKRQRPQKKKTGAHSLRSFFMMARRQQKNLSRPGPQGASSQRTRPHAKARPDRRRYCLQRTSATGAEFQPSVGTGKIRPQPVSSRGAFLIDALHGPTRQVLHRASPSGRNARICLRRTTEAVNTPDCEAGSQ